MMCTLIVAKNVFRDFPLLVVNNRDELLNRPSERPAMRDKDWRILAPKDLQRGGSWIGVNGYGVLAGLTNRLDVKSERGKMSRGDIVMQALRHRTAIESFVDLLSLKGPELNGFNLVIVDKRKMFLLRGNGKIIERTVEDDGLLVVTNHGVGRFVGNDMPPRVNTVLQTWYSARMSACRPTVNVLKILLNIHGGWRHGTCINEPAENYGTKSSGIIRLKDSVFGDVWQYSHRERTSPDRHICTERFDPVIKLPIHS
jgi:hypothetical protein